MFGVRGNTGFSISWLSTDAGDWDEAVHADMVGSSRAWGVRFLRCVDGRPMCRSSYATRSPSVDGAFDEASSRIADFAISSKSRSFKANSLRRAIRNAGSLVRSISFSSDSNSAASVTKRPCSIPGKGSTARRRDGPQPEGHFNCDTRLQYSSVRTFRLSASFCLLLSNPRHSERLM